MSYRWSTVVLLLVVMGTTGCAATAGEVVRGGVNQLAEPETQAVLRKLAPDIREASEDLASGLVGGALDALTDEERQQALAEMSRTFSTTIVGEMEKATGRLGPALRRQLTAAVRGVLAELLSERTRREAAATVERLVSTTTQPLARGLEKDLAPAVAGALRNDLGPAAQQVVNTNLRPVLAQTTKDVSKSAVLGFDEGVAGTTALDGKLKSASDALFDRFDRSVNQSLDKGQQTVRKVGDVAVYVAVALGVIVAALIAFVMWTRRRYAQSEQALKLLTKSIKESEQQGRAEALRSAIKKNGRTSEMKEGMLHLERFLAEHPDHRLPSQTTPGAAE